MSDAVRSKNEDLMQEFGRWLGRTFTGLALHYVSIGATEIGIDIFAAFLNQLR